MKVKTMLLGALVALAVAVAPAEARTLSQAQDDAYYFSAVDCPHHSAGRCGSRASAVITGIGGGRWTAQTQGWECAAWNFTGCSRASATWYYWRTFWIENNGTRSHVSGFGNDG